MERDNQKKRQGGERGEKNGRRGVWRSVLLVLMSAALVIGLFGVVGVIYYMRTAVIPQFDEEMTLPSMVGASHLYYYDFTDRTAREGVRVALENGELNGGVLCQPVKYAELPSELLQAFVAIEDKRFWQHHGVDWLRSVEAGVHYLTGFRHSGKFGASTITQQLVKNLTGHNDYSLHRKVQEMVWACALERQCTKEEILERYLNVINLSQGCYGVGAAAQYYFGKSVDALSLTECATLAAITNNPSYYDPVRFPEHTQSRRNVILDAMCAQGYISEEMCEQAKAQPLILCEREEKPRTPIYSWYTDMVIEDVIHDLCQQYSYTREQANRLLWNGGLTIEVAMDKELQDMVEAYYAQLSHFPVHDNGERAQSGIIVIDPSTGDILAVAGAIGEKGGNRLQSFATQALRPAASAIKPLSVYGPALERGLITWASVFDDVPVSFGNYNLNAAKGRIVKPVAWPQNANRIYRGLTDVRYAVAHSVNTVAVRVLRQLGKQQSFDFLHDTLQMEHLIAQRTLEDGRRITDCADAALALGQMNYGITLRELTAGYSMLAGGGVFVEPHSYFRVLGPDGEVLLSHTVNGRAVMSEQNACIMTKLLENVVTQGTAKGATLLNGRVQVAGKTGTSSADCDKWFVGYTPQYLTGVWYGFAYPRELSDVKGNPAVRIWHDVMTQVCQREQRRGTLLREFPMAPGVIRVTYCQDSGKRPTDACASDMRGSRCTQGYFVQGTEPKDYCSVHEWHEITPAEVSAPEGEEPTRQRVGLIRVARSFPKKIYVADQKYAAP